MTARPPVHHQAVVPEQSLPSCTTWGGPQQSRARPRRAGTVPSVWGPQHREAGLPSAPKTPHVGTVTASVLPESPHRGQGPAPPVPLGGWKLWPQSLEAPWRGARGSCGAGTQLGRGPCTWPSRGLHSFQHGGWLRGGIQSASPEEAASPFLSQASKSASPPAPSFRGGSHTQHGVGFLPAGRALPPAPHGPPRPPPCCASPQAELSPGDSRSRCLAHVLAADTWSQFSKGLRAPEVGGSLRTPACPVLPAERLVLALCPDSGLAGPHPPHALCDLEVWCPHFPPCFQIYVSAQISLIIKVKSKRVTLTLSSKRQPRW